MFYGKTVAFAQGFIFLFRQIAGQQFPPIRADRKQRLNLYQYVVFTLNMGLGAAKVSMRRFPRWVIWWGILGTTTLAMRAIAENYFANQLVSIIEDGVPGTHK